MNDNASPRPKLSPESEHKILWYLHRRVLASYSWRPSMTLKIGVDDQENEIKPDTGWIDAINKELNTLYSSFTDDEIAFMDWIKKTKPLGIKVYEKGI